MPLKPVADLKLLRVASILTDPNLDQAHLVRGSQSRISDHKEQLHKGIFKAVVAAAGCTYSERSLDLGCDIEVHHQINGFWDSLSINFQLKCTAKPITSTGFVVVELPVKRFNEMRFEGKNAPFLLVAQHVVDDQDQWVDFSGDTSVFGAKNYWLNLTGAKPRSVTSGDVEVRVPTSQVLDDNTLIHLFAQHRKGVLEK